MSREIKFRGMDLQGRWFYGNLAILTRDVAQGHKKGHYISNSVGMPFAYHVRPETVGQYTGLKDKNGKEIYEGDIVANGRLYCTGGFVIENEQTVVNFDKGMFRAKNISLVSFARSCKVIGNIYKIPNLSEDTNEHTATD